MPFIYGIELLAVIQGDDHLADFNRSAVGSLYICRYGYSHCFHCFDSGWIAHINSRLFLWIDDVGEKTDGDDRPAVKNFDSFVACSARVKDRTSFLVLRIGLRLKDDAT
jgi:hypothetical protein